MQLGPVAVQQQSKDTQRVVPRHPQNLLVRIFVAFLHFHPYFGHDGALTLYSHLLWCESLEGLASELALLARFLLYSCLTTQHTCAVHLCSCTMLNIVML
jgi:hypothetical protein